MEHAHRLEKIGLKPLYNRSIETSLREVSFFKSQQVIEIACGYHHIAALISSGQAFCWGFSAFGQCGVVASEQAFFFHFKFYNALKKSIIFFELQIAVS